jgi:hypothetical protein
MVSAGVITDYAVSGAVAQMRYTEAVSTMDADILVGLSERPGLDILKPINDYCVSKGYRSEGDAVRVGDWPDPSGPQGRSRGPTAQPIIPEPCASVPA